MSVVFLGNVPAEICNLINKKIDLHSFSIGDKGKLMQPNKTRNYVYVFISLGLRLYFLLP